MKKKHATGGVLLLFGFAGWSLGAQFAVPEKGGEVVVKEGVRNLYAAGGTVKAEAPIKGDLVAAGGTILISAPVEQDLIAAGGQLTLDKTVGGDARLLGGKVELNAPIGGDLIVGAGKITVNTEAGIKGDVVLAGGEVVLEGPVSGKILAAGGKILLNGNFAGDVTARADQLLEIGPRCKIKGKLNYYAPSEISVPPGASVPHLEFHKVEGSGKGAAGATAAVIGFWALVRLGAWILAAWLMRTFLRRPLEAVLGVIQTDPWRDLGMGLLVVAATFIAIPLLFATLVGYYAALMAGALLGLGLLTSRLLAGYYAGVLLRRWFAKKKDLPIPFGWVAGGILALHLIGSIPVLGWLISLGLTLTALGSIWGLTVKCASLGEQNSVG